MSIYVYIFAMAAVTYIIRMLPLCTFQKKITNQFLLSFLYYVPYACLTAMTIPAIFSSTSSLYSAVAGFCAAAVLGYFKRGLVTVAVASSATVFIAELIINFL